ncbi:MAG: pinensin family lanthipeptide [Bacteroidota bacterium]
MKNKKLGLDALKVKSFVTSLKGGEEKTVKGGHNFTFHPCFVNDHTYQPDLCELTMIACDED